MRTNPPHRLVGAVLIAGALLVSTTHVVAQSTDPVAATELFKQGREAIGKGDYVTACKKFDESARLDLKVGTLLNLAECEEHLTKIAAARQHLQRAVDLATAQNDERLELAKTRLTAIDKRVPRLTVTLRPQSNRIEGVRVRRDEVDLGAGSLGSSLPVDPGEHVVTVSAAGHEDKTFKVTLKEAEQQTLAVDVGPASSMSSSSSSGGSLPPPTGSEGSSTRTIGYVVGGVGALALATGGIFALIAINNNAKSNENDRCKDNLCDDDGLAARNDARSAGNIATIFFIGGGVALAAGAVLVFTSPSDPKKSARLGPSVTHQGAGLSLGGTF
jgi:hypothetical protein